MRTLECSFITTFRPLDHHAVPNAGILYSIPLIPGSAFIHIGQKDVYCHIKQ